MVDLSYSVRAFNDLKFQRMQYICRLYCQQLLEELELREEFISLCSKCLNFVGNLYRQQLDYIQRRFLLEKSPNILQIE